MIIMTKYNETKKALYKNRNRIITMEEKEVIDFLIRNPIVGDKFKMRTIDHAYYYINYVKNV